MTRWESRLLKHALSNRRTSPGVEEAADLRKSFASTFHAFGGSNCTTSRKTHGFGLTSGRLGSPCTLHSSTSAGFNFKPTARMLQSIDVPASGGVALPSSLARTLGTILPEVRTPSA